MRHRHQARLRRHSAALPVGGSRRPASCWLHGSRGSSRCVAKQHFFSAAAPHATLVCSPEVTCGRVRRSQRPKRHLRGVHDRAVFDAPVFRGDRRTARGWGRSGSIGLIVELARDSTGILVLLQSGESSFNRQAQDHDGARVGWMSIWTPVKR